MENSSISIYRACLVVWMGGSSSYLENLALAWLRACNIIATVVQTGGALKGDWVGYVEEDLVSTHY